MPSGQGPSRRPGSSRVRSTSATRTTSTTRVPPGRTRSRPAPTRRTANGGTGPAKRTAAPRPRALTGRATVLIVVFVALALAYTYPLRVYLAQESQIAQLEADHAAESKVIADKQAQLQKWNDPAYLEAQARERLFYVRPGDKTLLVQRNANPAASTTGSQPAAAPDRWYDTLWHSVRAADEESQN